MKRFKLFCKWLWKAWPIIIFLFIGLIHLFLFSFISDENRRFINTILSSSLQLIGGVIILFNINENIWDFRNENIFSRIKNYFRTCPLIKRNVDLSCHSVLLSAALVGKGTLSVKKSWETIEERFEELERRIDDLRDLISQMEKGFHKELSSAKATINESIKENRNKINDVNSLLDRTIMGDIEYQLFGILLVVYGFSLDIVLLFTNR